MGWAPEALKGLDGFDRNDADLPADLAFARHFSEILGDIVDQHPFSIRAMYVSANGFFTAAPPLPQQGTAQGTPALLRLFASRPYFRRAIAQGADTRSMTWGGLLREAGTGPNVFGFSAPVYVRGRFRGVLIIFATQEYLQQLTGAGATTSQNSLLLDREGNVLASTGALDMAADSPLAQAVRSRILASAHRDGTHVARAGTAPTSSTSGSMTTGCCCTSSRPPRCIARCSAASRPPCWASRCWPSS